VATRTSQKADKAKFAFWGFSEVRFKWILRSWHGPGPIPALLGPGLCRVSRRFVFYALDVPASAAPGIIGSKAIKARFAIKSPGSRLIVEAEYREEDSL
jgi:hypothetical protein